MVLWRTNAKLNNPRGVKVDAAGNVFIADVNNNRIRKVDASGNINTIAGGGGSTSMGVPATTALLYQPGYDF
jgi:DNA-binding beta-propeller fold protein YncE